jgi:hypothetical protein
MTFILLVIAFFVYLLLAVVEANSSYHFLYVLGLVYTTGHLSLGVGVTLGLAHNPASIDKTK